MKLRNIVLGLLLGISILFPVFVNAQSSLADEIARQNEQFAGSEGANFGDPTDVRIIIARIIKIFLSIVGLLIITYTIYGGYLILTSSGNEERVTLGRKVVGYGALGALIILMSYSFAWFTYYIIYKGTQNPFGSYFFFGVEQDTTEYYVNDPLEQSTVPDQFNLF